MSAIQDLVSRRVEAAPDFRKFTDEQIAEAIRELERNKLVITADLEADQAEGEARGRTWRLAAGRARSFAIAHLTQARAEEARRLQVVQSAAGQGSKPAKSAAHAEVLQRQTEAVEMRAREVEARAQAHQLGIDLNRTRKEAAQAENDAAWQKRQARLARMFLAAARRSLPRADLNVIWDEARLMFPDAPEWKAFP